MTEEQIKIDISNAKSKYLISLKKIEEESIKNTLEKRQKEILLQHENDLYYIKKYGITLAELREKHKEDPDHQIHYKTDFEYAQEEKEDSDFPDWNSFEEVYMVGK